MFTLINWKEHGRMKANMFNSYIGLNDLPDEILIYIFQKLNNVDVLYSLQNVNQRLNQIIHDSIFTNRLAFVKWLPFKYIDLFSSSHMMLNRFCSQILPSIHQNIKSLDLESSSMKHVLCAADYPNLNSFGLYNINEESARSLFTGKMNDLSNLSTSVTRSLNIFRQKSFIWYFPKSDYNTSYFN
jgi:hypothetical protein